MIPSLAEIVSSIVGGARLLCFRPDGMKPMKRDEAAPLRSFFVMVLTLPGFLLLLTQRGGPVADDDLHFYAVWLLAYVISWLAFPVVLFAMASQLPARRGLPFFIQARNWMLVTGAYVALATFTLADSALLPEDLSQFLVLAVEAWIYVAQWWLLRRIINASAGQAALLIMIDFMLDYALMAWAVSRTALPLAGG